MTAIRVNLTIEFDETTITADAIKDRLDDLLVQEFSDVTDWHTRWVSDLSQSPLFGAAQQPYPKQGRQSAHTIKTSHGG